jgi:hypothetical protein
MARLRTPEGTSKERRTRYARRWLRAARRRLGPTGRTDPWVLAIMATEAYFKRRAGRILEGIAWPVLSVVWPARLATLSVGVAQIQLRHWVSLGQLSGVRFTPPRLWRVLSLRRNYDACAAYLNERAQLDELDVPTAVRLYTGGMNPSYAHVLTTALHEW